MARTPVLTGGLLMMWMALTTGCQTTPPRKPSPTPITWDNQPKNKQLVGNPGMSTSDAPKFPTSPSSPSVNGQLTGNPPATFGNQPTSFNQPTGLGNQQPSLGNQQPTGFKNSPPSFDNLPTTPSLNTQGNNSTGMPPPTILPTGRVTQPPAQQPEPALPQAPLPDISFPPTK